MKLPLHTERGGGKYVDLIDAKGCTVALDLMPVSASYIVNATNNADAQAARIEVLERELRLISKLDQSATARKIASEALDKRPPTNHVKRVSQPHIVYVDFAETTPEQRDDLRAAGLDVREMRKK